MFNKLRNYIGAFLERDRCMFRKRCKFYKEGNRVCNDWLKRFPTGDEAYCGKYRGLKEGE